VLGISPAHAIQPAIASAHPLATAAGMKILNDGGNAFDAAVAVSAVLAVVEPYSSGLGGRGYWMLHRAEDLFEVMIDAREKAPLAASRDMYLDEDGEIVEGLSINGALAAGIPGEPAALAHIAEHYGRLSLKQTLQPAIEFAEKAFPVNSVYRKMLGFRADALRQDGEGAEIFLHEDDVPELGNIIQQPDLANTLRLIAAKGHAGFYVGSVAQALVSGVQAAGGIWSEKDLAGYQIIERQPIKGKYRNVEITTAALPSSGGIVLLQILNQLEGFDLNAQSEAGLIHLITESMRRGYRDRAEHLGDTDFIDVPVQALLSKDYARELRSFFNPDKATESHSMKAVAIKQLEGRDTTHFSVLDKDGNRVAATLSINYPFGSGFVPPGTGILLNDEMDDFSSKPGTPNVYGLVGNEANAISPGKRMLSSMTPTFLDDGQRFAVIGTPGGSRIITMVLLGTLAFEQGASAAEIVAVPRFHHQYLPDKIEVEDGAISATAQTKLKAMGHDIQPFKWVPGDMQVIVYDRKNSTTEFASDPRGLGE
jgi:gamma-glutamyltranspeptidase/glutathione hydrolase